MAECSVVETVVKRAAWMAAQMAYQTVVEMARSWVDLAVVLRVESLVAQLVAD